MLTVKTFSQGNSLVVVIPYFYRRLLKLRPGDILTVEVIGEALILRELKEHENPTAKAHARPLRHEPGGEDNES